MSALNWGAVREFQTACERAGIEPPASARTALHHLDVIERFVSTPVTTVLGLSDAKLRARVADISLRSHDSGAPANRGMRPGRDRVAQELADELRAVVGGELDPIIEALQPKWRAAAEPLEAAARLGIESTTTSEEILARSDFEEAGLAWRALRAGWAELFPIVRLRIGMCRTFELAPTLRDAKRAGHNLRGDDSRLNYSILFGSGGNWSLDPAKYHVGNNRLTNIDWLQLAKHGLRLNSTAEVAEKIEARHGSSDAADAPTSLWDGDALSLTYPR